MIRVAQAIHLPLGEYGRGVGLALGAKRSLEPVTGARQIIAVMVLRIRPAFDSRPFSLG